MVSGESLPWHQQRIMQVGHRILVDPGVEGQQLFEARPGEGTRCEAPRQEAVLGVEAGMWGATGGGIGSPPWPPRTAAGRIPAPSAAPPRARARSAPPGPRRACRRGPLQGPPRRRPSPPPPPSPAAAPLPGPCGPPTSPDLVGVGRSRWGSSMCSSQLRGRAPTRKRQWCRQ